MTLFTKTVTEKLNMRDARQQPNQFTIEINGVDYTTQLVDFKLQKHLNDVNFMSFVLFGLQSSDRTTNIENQKIVRFKLSGFELFKGQIQDVDWQTDGFSRVICVDQSVKLAEAFTTNTYSKTATSTTTILSQLASTNLDGASPFVMAVGTNDVPGTVDFSAKNMDRRMAIAKLASQTGADWWVSESGGVDQINLSPEKESTSSVRTYDLQGNTRNAIKTFREKDKSKLWNKIIVLGNGDGTTQITSDPAEDATSQSTYGVIEYKHVDRRIESKAQADELAAQILSEHKDPVERIRLLVFSDDEMFTSLRRVDVGNRITVNDSDAELSSQVFQVIGYELKRQDQFTLEFELANKRFTYFEQVNKIDRNVNDIGGGKQIIDPGHDHNQQLFTQGGHDHNQNLFSQVGHDHNQQLFTQTNHTHSISTTATSDVNNDTRSAYFQLDYTEGTLINTSTSNQGFSIELPSLTESNFRGAHLYAGIFNKTGSTQSYNITIKNLTTSNTLHSQNSISVPHNSIEIIGITKYLSLVDEGDIIEFRITSGTIGTASGANNHGYMSLLMTSFGEHDHSVSGQTGLGNTAQFTSANDTQDGTSNFTSANDTQDGTATFSDANTAEPNTTGTTG